MSIPTNNSDECVSVRLPAGMKDQLRAASGMPISKFFRTMGAAFLAQRKAQRKPSALAEINEAVEQINLGAES